MSSYIDIIKICKHCGCTFNAKSTITKYCSHKCASKAYKRNKRKIKIESSNKDVLNKLISTELPILQHREYFTVSKAAILLGVSRATMYRYLAANIIKSLVIQGKTFVRKQDIDVLFDNAGPYQIKAKHDENSTEEYYTIHEIKEKYNVKERWIYNVVNRKKVPKIFYRGKNLYSKKHVDKAFSDKIADATITEWYSVEEIQERFNMTATAVYSFVYENRIPKKKDGKKVYYSKDHVDIAKGIKVAEEPQYYTTPEAMEKYNLTRDALYHYVKYHNIPKIKEGKCIKISMVHLDELFNKSIKL